ncbi:MAG: transcriptional regulator, partial [Pseudomonadota bacterium]
MANSSFQSGAPIRCADCAIRERAVCSYCSNDDLAQLDRIKSYRTYAVGQEIIGAGEPLDFVGSVVSGVVKLTKTLIDGRRQMVG